MLYKLQNKVCKLRRENKKKLETFVNYEESIVSLCQLGGKPYQFFETYIA
jgi:hypothetical protein